MSGKDKEMDGDELNARWMKEQIDKAWEFDKWRKAQTERLAIICAANDTERKIKEAEERGAREMAAFLHRGAPPDTLKLIVDDCVRRLKEWKEDK